MHTQDSYELCEYNYTAIKKYLLEHIQELIGTKNELFKLFFPEIYFAFAPLNEIQAETEPLFCFDEKKHNWYVNFLTFKKKNVFKSMLTNALHLENIVEFKENNWLSYDDYLKTMANRRLKSKFNHVEYPIFNSKQSKEQIFQLPDDQIYTFL